jgi:hypothetical protein
MKNLQGTEGALFIIYFITKIPACMNNLHKNFVYSIRKRLGENLDAPPPRL